MLLSPSVRGALGIPFYGTDFHLKTPSATGSAKPGITATPRRLQGRKECPEWCQGLRKSHRLLLTSKWEVGRGRARRLLCKEPAGKERLESVPIRGDQGSGSPLQGAGRDGGVQLGEGSRETLEPFPVSKGAPKTLERDLG